MRPRSIAIWYTFEMSKSIQINWRVQEAKGFTDVLPFGLFEKTGNHARAMHKVLGPKGGEYDAYFALQVTDTTAKLDYRQFPEENRNAEMCLGVLTVKFRDSTRSDVDDVLWKELPEEGEQSIIKDESAVVFVR